MATWHQGINSGGFLAGIGAQNENAPKASDINATLDLIRENNELARSGANNVGLTALRGLAGVADIYNQELQQKAISAFNRFTLMHGLLVIHRDYLSLPRKIQRLLHRHNRRFPVLMSSNATIWAI